MNINQWKERISQRSDITTGLVHLTKGNDTMSAGQVLFKILKEGKLKGSTTSSGFICGDIEAVCLQDTPLYSLAQNVYFEQGLIKEGKSNKTRYTAFGIRFEKRFVYKKGGRPVIYDRIKDAKKYLPDTEWWRIVNLELSNDENIIDWTHEREWRVPKELTFELSEISIVVGSTKALNSFKNYCLERGIDIVNEVKSVINLGEIFF